MRNSFLLFIICVMALYARTADAQPREVHLQYVRGPGAESCPDEAAVRTAIRAEMGYNPFTPTATDRLVVTLSGEGGKVRGQVEFRAAGRPSWTQDFKPHDCEMVITSMALHIGNQLDPLFASATERSTPPTPAPPPAASGAVPPIPATTPKPSAKPTPARAGLRVGIGGGGGFVPGAGPSDVTGQASTAVVLWLRYVHVGFELQGQPPAGTEQDGVILAAWRLSGGVIPCVHWPPAEDMVTTVYGCGVTQVGAWFGQAAAYTTDSGTTLYAVAGPRAGVQVAATGWLTFTIFADLLGIFNRPALVVDGERRYLHSAVTGAAGAQALAFF